MPQWLIALGVKFMFKKLKDKLLQKLKDKYKVVGAAGVVTLLIGAIAGVLNIDLAPDQIDALVTGFGVLLYAFREWQENRNGE
jgi:hypothetical protein